MKPRALLKQAETKGEEAFGGSHAASPNTEGEDTTFSQCESEGDEMIATRFSATNARFLQGIASKNPKGDRAALTMNHWGIPARDTRPRRSEASTFSFARFATNHTVSQSAFLNRPSKSHKNPISNFMYSSQFASQYQISSIRVSASHDTFGNRLTPAPYPVPQSERTFPDSRMLQVPPRHERHVNLGWIIRPREAFPKLWPKSFHPASHDVRLLSPTNLLIKLQGDRHHSVHRLSPSSLYF
ncbi:uncharacterized protein CLUP02_05877 [Colletotrichum lupini]|uniref:Uncharacterized protein n=1 Tax=Colletotrichum lupini TaxID=145971 RepID=A0A9Q8WEH0_9PEZI|nr:uncharacterized protein CLUP02_05877 [Colletotrichum lupini]UQC80394.1 hypothetical protein CLUP02_05877 [Colletotrichum lupini]